MHFSPRTLKIIIGVSAVIIVVVGVVQIPGVRDEFRLRMTREVKKVVYTTAIVDEEARDAATYRTWGKTATSTLLAVPFLPQKYSLSCEIAALRMALVYKGIDVTEDDLIASMPFATLEPIARDPKTRKPIWGDPNEGFVGIINGKMPFTGYGVYEKPILLVAQLYHDSRILENATIQSLVAEVAKGNPVVVWGSITNGRDISWTTPDGRKIKAIEGEHARVVVGFQGPEHAPTAIYIMDPVYGKIHFTIPEFIQDWGLLGNKAVVVG